MAIKKEITHAALLRILDPLYGYGWDIYPKSTLLVLVDSLAYDFEIEWLEESYRLEPEMSETWPSPRTVEQIARSTKFVDKLDASIQSLVTWGEGIHCETSERLPPLLPKARWLSELIGFKLGPSENRHRVPSLVRVTGDYSAYEPEEEISSYVEQLNESSAYYDFDLCPQPIASALLDWEIENQLTLWYADVVDSIQSGLDPNLWPVTVDDLVEQIVDTVLARARNRFGWALERHYLFLRDDAHSDPTLQREKLTRVLQMRLSRWPDFFAPIHQAIARQRESTT